MTVKFDQPKNEFPQTLFKAILSVIVAAILGCILGDSVQAYLGTNMDYEISNRYTERMSAVVTWFADDMLPLTDENGVDLQDENGDPILGVYFQRTGQALSGQGDGEILRSASGQPVAVVDGTAMAAADCYDEELTQSLENLFVVPDCFSDNLDTMTGEPIDDVLLYNIAVRGETVYFYVYYDAYGYVAITYDPTEALASEKDVVSLSSAPGWYVVFAYEE
jgi:hypothetical protein